MVLVSMTTLVKMSYSQDRQQITGNGQRLAGVAPEQRHNGCAKATKPTAHGMVIRPRMCTADSSVFLAPLALRSVSCAAMAGKMLMESGDTKAYGKLKMV